MRILICGASGFVGRHLADALERAGHECIRGVRHPARASDIAIDYSRDTAAETWLPRLAGIEVVVNAIGVLRDSKKQPMASVHGATPAALFHACGEAGVKRVVQVSALGVGGPIDTLYFSSKEVAERALEMERERLSYLILRPSVIYGEDGASARMFRLQAKLPVHALPMAGRQRMQPVHIDDVVEAVINWLADPQAPSQTLTASGADVVTMAEMLASYRSQMGYGVALRIAVPGFLVRMGARCGDYVPASPLCSDTLRMLDAGSVGDNTALAKLLGRPPLSVHAFMRSGT